MSESEINRRAMLARLGLTATAIYTVPAITTLSAAHASSPSGGDSNDDNSSPSEDDNSSPSEDDTSGPSDDDSSASAESTCGKNVVGAVCN